MIATLSFFFLTITAKIEALSLTPDVERCVYDRLIPGIYLDIVSTKASTKEQREALRKKSQELLFPLQSENSPLKDMDQKETALLESIAVECAQIFQRSSSCVEGRNGHLSLYHHSLHRLSQCR